MTHENERIGLSDAELHKLPIQRVSVQQTTLDGAWRTTLYRKGPQRVHEETLPTRAKETLALEDVRFYAPHMYDAVLATLVARRKQRREVKRERTKARRRA